MGLSAWTGKLAGDARLDRVADPLRARVRRVLGSGPADAVLSGRWLGHPLHPAVIHLPVGAWLSGAVLDLSPRHRAAATLLTGVGLAGAVPSALAGWHDWAALSRPQRRVGLVHAGSNLLAVALYGASLAARRGGAPGVGRGLSVAGLCAAGVGAYLGGHLSYHGRHLTSPHPASDRADADAVSI
ncbi:membrane protein [Pilimelia terevasa]|uniref:Membrane protein n=1 Tax=Pilimelia terevasa TaxID=53372 RepID=A0A8J3BLY9_9ACTN|nr:DUF2231 domain-containing protein [Pilimelia terevasa]GGK23980.1 membrane protein [Pilimelia terevasa]